MTVGLQEELVEQGPQHPLWKEKVSTHDTMYIWHNVHMHTINNWHIYSYIKSIQSIITVVLFICTWEGCEVKVELFAELNFPVVRCTWMGRHSEEYSIKLELAVNNNLLLKSQPWFGFLHKSVYIKTCLEREGLVWKSLPSRPRFFCSRCCWTPRGCRSSAGRAAWRRGRGRWWRWCRRRRRWSPREAPSRRFP